MRGFSGLDRASAVVMWQQWRYWVECGSNGNKSRKQKEDFAIKQIKGLESQMKQEN